MRSVIATGLGLGIIGSASAAEPRIFNVFLSSPEMLGKLPVCTVTVSWGIKLIRSGVKGVRVGESLHCPNCDYELGVEPEEAPIRCPECGAAWLGRWVNGELRKSPPR